MNNPLGMGTNLTLYDSIIIFINFMFPKYRWSHYTDEANYNDPYSYYDDGINQPKVVKGTEHNVIG